MHKRRSESFVRFFICLLCAVGALTSLAYDTTGYVKLTTSDSSYSNSTSFEKPSFWTWPSSYGGTPAAMDPNADYFYSSSERISRTPNTRDFTFDARTLAVNGQFHQSSAYYFTMTNMHLLAGGQFVIWGTYSRFSNCMFTVYARAANPFTANVAVAGGGRGYGFTFKDTTLVGDADAVMKLVGSRAGQTIAAFRWTGDGSRYLGTLGVDMTSDVTAATACSVLYLGAVDFGGTVALGSRGRLRAHESSACRLARLTAAAGAAIEYEPGNGPLVVTKSLSCASTLGVRLSLSSRPSVVTPDADVLRAPSGSLARDALDVTLLDGSALPDWATWEVVDDGTTARLVLKQKPCVSLDNYGTSAKSPFAGENAAYWSDGLAPHAGSDYRMAKSGTAYLPDGVDTYAFPGDSLEMRSSAVLVSATLGPQVFRCDDLTVNGATLRAWSHDFSVEGGPVAMDGRLTLMTHGGALYTLSLLAELVGAGELVVKSAVSSAANASAGCAEIVSLNTNYTGRIVVTMPTDLTRDYGPVPSDVRCMTLRFSDARNLGAPLAAFDPDALLLEQMSVLKPLNDVTLDTPNRGVRIAGCGRVDIPEGVTLTLANPVTYAGSFWKEGAGTLALSARPRFCEGGEDAVPLTGTNVLRVLAGSVMPLTTNCLDGVRVQLGLGGTLRYQVAPSDAALRAYGIVNLAEPDGVPFSLDDVVLDNRLSVTFDTTSAPSPEDAETALFTVTKAAAAEILPKLDLHKAYPNAVPEVGVRTNADDTVTIFATQRAAGVHTVTPTSAETPLFTSASALAVPSAGHLVFSGWTDEALSNACVVIAQAPSYVLPETWENWTCEPSLADHTLAFAVEEGTLVARLRPDVYAYARPRGFLCLSSLGDSALFKFHAGNNDAQGLQTPAGLNDYAFTNVTGIGSLMFTGLLRVRQHDTRTARAVWTFTPDASVSETDLSNVGILQGIPASYGFAGFATNGAPAAIAKSGSFFKDMSSISVFSTDPEKDFTVVFPTKTSVWASLLTSGTLSLKFYCYPPEGGFVGGETYSFVMDLAARSAVKAEMPQPVVYARNEDWIPTSAMPYVRPGSPLDLTDVCGTGKPAGKYGRVRRVGDGFEFEGRPGVPVRFWGITQGASQYVAQPSLRDPGLADMARRGYNATRVHDYESAIVSTEDPTQTSFDPEKMRLFDGYIASSISNGLYVVLELYGNHRTPSWRSIGEDRDGVVTRDEVKSLLITHEGMISNQLDYIRAYLTHVNEYTGRSFLDEPAVIGADLVNEHLNGIQRVTSLNTTAGLDIKQAWAQHVAQHAGDPDWEGVDGSTVPGSTTSSKSGRFYCQFLREKIVAFESRVRRFIREELHSELPLTNLNQGTPVAYGDAQPECRDYVDVHYYQDHPNFLEKEWQAPFSFRHKGSNPILHSHLGVPAAAMGAHRGYPFLMTEFNYCAPTHFRMSAGLILGSVSALQGWDGLWQHSLAFRTADSATSNFSYLDDPLMPAWSRMATFLYARGDLPALANEYVTRLDRDALRSPDAAQESGYEFTSSLMGRMAWYAKIGLSVTNELPAGVATSGDWPTTRAKDEAALFADLGLARGADGSLPVAGGGHVTIDDARGALSVFTDRTCGGFAEEGTIAAGVLTADLGGVPAAVSISSLDGQPLTTSRRMLLSHLTDVQDTGSRFLDASSLVFLNWGGLPHLMRRGRATVSLDIGSGKFRVFALAADGSRRYEVPITVTSGGLALTCDTARDPNEATYLYEIVRARGIALSIW